MIVEVTLFNDAKLVRTLFIQANNEDDAISKAICEVYDYGNGTRENAPKGLTWHTRG